MVLKVILGQIYLRAIILPLKMIIPRMLYTHLSSEAGAIVPLEAAVTKGCSPIPDPGIYRALLSTGQ
jgi:hypothetical protein